MMSGASRCHREHTASTEKESPTTTHIAHAIHDEGSSIPEINNPMESSGTNNTNRTGYHEDKCRNVLVRYCAHIPRNYQYKDGIQQIFLILREHLGDENLDLAGGVLYELIEVDCEHTDDPGAAFQRWKHDHLRRYADLELPHVPHMTTITPKIIPTKKLAQWRLKHSSRYPFVLSDSSPSSQRASVDPSCIRNRKAWLIDHTLYISSRNVGTRAINSPNPKEFHEMQWNHEYGTQGRLIEERDVPIISPDRPSETSPPGTADTLLGTSDYLKGLRRYSHKFGLFDKFKSRVHAQNQKSEVEQKRHSWIPGALMFETAPLFRDKRTNPDIAVVPFPEGCQIPNAIFARKYLLVETSDSLPLALSLKHMPTAESKATETILEAATNGLLNQTESWSFRGPFTPQLGFDGGLDYQWSPQEPAITFRRFDVNDSTQDTTDIYPDDRIEDELSIIKGHSIPQRTSAKRQGMIFSVSTESDGDNDTIQQPANYTTSNISILNSQEFSIPRGLDGTACIPLTLEEPLMPSAQLDSAPNQVEFSTVERNKCGMNRRDPFFKNVEFTMPVKASEVEASTSNRKFTVVEISPNHSPQTSNCEFS